MNITLKDPATLDDPCCLTLHVRGYSDREAAIEELYNCILSATKLEGNRWSASARPYTDEAGEYLEITTFCRRLQFDHDSVRANTKIAMLAAGLTVVDEIGE